MVYPLSNLPQDRESFKAFCMRRLGAPVIDIEIDDDQIEDAVNTALQYWMEFHVDGSTKQYYKYQLQSADIANGYITMPDNIIGAIKIFEVTASLRQDDLFNIRYQIVLNDLYTLTSVSMVPFYQTFMHLQFLEQLLVGEAPVRYNRHENKLYIDIDWDRFVVGDFLIVECYGVVDPDVFTKAWSDRMLAQLAVGYMKKQWGQNTMKFGGIQILGGVTFNGEKIYAEGVREIEEAEEKIFSQYSQMPEVFIG